MADMRTPRVGVFCDGYTARYHFGPEHPFGPGRQAAFWTELRARGLDERVECLPSRAATDAELTRFHDAEYVAFVARAAAGGSGFLDDGDTPAVAGIDQAARHVAGAALAAAEAIMDKRLDRAFLPIGGLHHAARDHAAGFCVFDDIGVVIETLRARHGLRRIAYVDIDAHHGDGVFYAFEADPDLIIADIHEDGRYLYPGTGTADETGLGPAVGSKLNLPLRPGAGDDEFMAAWARAEAHVAAARPEFIILQCGADSLAGDPITHLALSAGAHGFAARRLCAVAGGSAHGRLLALGGGGYAHANLAAAWCAVVESLLEAA